MIFRSLLLPSSIQLLRCTAEAVRRREPGSRRPSGPLVGGLRWSTRIRGGCAVVPDTRRRLEDQPANRRTMSRRGTRRVVSGIGPELFDLSVYARTLTREVPPIGKVVETRRLELLTLSLQRRCSSS